MTLSATFTFSGVATSLAKKSVAASTAFTATIDDLSGVDSVTWSIVGTEGVNAASDYTLTPSGAKGSIVTITSKTAFRGAMLQAVVTSGGFYDRKRAIFFVPSTISSLEPLIFDELFESDATHAYVAKLNAALLAFDGAAGFNAEAATVNIATTATPTTINIGTNASAHDINIGSSGATLNVTATNDTFFTLDAFEMNCASSIYLGSTAETRLVSGATPLINDDRLEPPHHVRGASTANVSLTGALTHDGVTYSTGQLFHAKDQSAGAENGPWVINTAGAWARPAWYTTALAAVNMLVLVAEGSTNAGRCYRLATTGTITVGATSTSWSQFGAGGGSSTTISDGTASVACATPDVTTTCASGACTVNAQDVTLTASGTAVLAGDASAVTITLDSAGITAVCASTDAIVHAVGSSEERHTVSGANRVIVIEDAAGSTAKTGTYDNAASSEVYAGTLAISCTGALTVTGSTDFNLNAIVGAGYLSCNGNLRNTVGGALVNNVYGRMCEWNDQAGTERRATLRWDAAVVMASAGTPSTQMAISLATAGTDITIRGRHSVKPTAGGAAQITIFEASYENVAGTVTIVGSAAIASSGATLGTFSISISGTTLNLVFTPTLATSYTGKATELDMRF